MQKGQISDLYNDKILDISGQISEIVVKKVSSFVFNENNFSWPQFSD